MLEETQPSGRPQPNKNPEDAKTHWTETLLDLYQSGRSDVEVCKELKLTRKQFEQYMSESDAFADLVQRGRDYAEAWWMEQGRVNLKNRDFVTTLWQFNMVNRHGWASKRESAQVDPNLNLDKLKDELRKALPEIGKMLNTDVIDLDDARRAVVKTSGKK
jgi:hypothetical protein